MANPAPTINQINAFNATQGTTIDFNIIGGTELVRSNKIYIYDLSDNSLICTHLYVSTESIHELPANTDSSIVYESGKSSADFVNGAQYYAQIQTFTDIAGTEGGSGLSVAKMFWCLNNPTLTINTIPSTISTTSYNVSATYNANTSVVSNIIQLDPGDGVYPIGSKYAFIIGNGEDPGDGNIVRSNALTVDWDGNVEAAGEVHGTLSNPTISITASTGTLQSATVYKQGNVVQLLVSVQKTTATASGQDVFKGTINTTALRPKMTTTGGTYYGSYALNAAISTAGTITIRNSDSRQLAAMTSYANVSFAYLVD